MPQNDETTILALKALETKLDKLNEFKSIEVIAKDIETYVNTAKDEAIKAINALAPYKKSYRVLYNAHTLYITPAIQEVLRDSTNAIVKYGDVYMFGNYGTNNGIATTALSRVALPSDIEFSEVIGGPNTFFALPKGWEGNANYMYVWGKNQYGEAGVGHTTAITTPQKIEFPKPIKSLCVNKTIYQYALVILADGSVWGAGYSGTGELGIGNTTNQSKFLQIPNIANAKKAFAISSSIFIIDSNGDVWGAGYNGTGELGIGNTTNQSKFVRILQGKNIISVNCNHLTTFFLSSNGELYACGQNANKEISGSTNAKELIPVQLMDNTNSPLQNIKEVISSGGVYQIALALDRDNNLWAWGHGYYGYGNANTTINQNAQIVARNVESVANFGNYYSSSRTQVTIIKKINGGLEYFGLPTFGAAVNSKASTPLSLPQDIVDFGILGHKNANSNTFACISGDSIYLSYLCATTPTKLLI